MGMRRVVNVYKFYEEYLRWIHIFYFVQLARVVTAQGDSGNAFPIYFDKEGVRPHLNPGSSKTK